MNGHLGERCGRYRGYRKADVAYITRTLCGMEGRCDTTICEQSRTMYHGLRHSLIQAPQDPLAPNGILCDPGASREITRNVSSKGGRTSSAARSCNHDGSPSSESNDSAFTQQPRIVRLRMESSQIHNQILVQIIRIDCVDAASNTIRKSNEFEGDMMVWGEPPLAKRKARTDIGSAL